MFKFSNATKLKLVELCYCVNMALDIGVAILISKSQK